MHPTFTSNRQLVGDKRPKCDHSHVYPLRCIGGFLAHHLRRRRLNAIRAFPASSVGNAPVWPALGPRFDPWPGHFFHFSEISPRRPQNRRVPAGSVTSGAGSVSAAAADDILIFGFWPCRCHAGRKSASLFPGWLSREGVGLVGWRLLVRTLAAALFFQHQQVGNFHGKFHKFIPWRVSGSKSIPWRVSGSKFIPWRVSVHNFIPWRVSV